MGDSDANLLALARSEEVVGHRAVEEEMVTVVPIGHGQYQRSFRSKHSHMGNQPGIENVDDIRLCIPTPSRGAADFDPLRWRRILLM